MEIEGQLTLTELYPNTCCGLVPWLRYTACCKWHEDQKQEYLMYYICPNCFKEPCDSTGWIIRSKGSFEDAKAKALAVWNNPETTFKHDKDDCLHITSNRVEEFETKYGVKIPKWRIKKGKINEKK